MKKKIEPENIAVIRTDRIGEVLLSTVAVDALKKRYPSARIFFVTSEYSLPIVNDRKDIEGVMTVETIRVKRGLIKTAIKLAKYLRREKIDTVVVLNPHKALHMACFLAGVKRRVGYDRKFGFLLNIKMRDLRDNGEKHETEYTMDVMRLLDAAYPSLMPRLSVNPMADKEVSDILEKEGLKEDKPIVVIHPSSSNPAKRWPPENYMELICRMKAELDCEVAIVGDAGEGIITDRVQHIKGITVLDLAGKFDLKQLAAFMKRSALFIGNDTGPMHMAAALGVPVIAIFGRNIPGVSPVRWCPLGEGHVVFHSGSVCRTCADPGCPHGHKCLKMVRVDDVFAAAKEILSRCHA